MTERDWHAYSEPDPLAEVGKVRASVTDLIAAGEALDTRVEALEARVARLEEELP